MRRCPLCRRETSWDDNPWKPFCSERCQTIDLGNWASEGYRVPLTETSDGLLPNEFIEELESISNEQQ
jgi:endogenous inhibitor of DNA gyrase (YacG/DUF329 family)